MISFRSNGFESLHASATPAKLNWANRWTQMLKRNKKMYSAQEHLADRIGTRARVHTQTHAHPHVTAFFPAVYRFASTSPGHEHTPQEKPMSRYANSHIRGIRKTLRTIFTLVSRRHAQSIASFLARYACRVRSFHQYGNASADQMFAVCRANCNYSVFFHSSISLWQHFPTCCCCCATASRFATLW